MLQPCFGRLSAEWPRFRFGRKRVVCETFGTSVGVLKLKLVTTSQGSKLGNFLQDYAEKLTVFSSELGVYSGPESPQ